MGAGYHGGFGKTKGYMQKNKNTTPRSKAISAQGEVTEKSITEHAEFFLGKSIGRMEKELKLRGYETIRRPSKHSTSRAKIIITTKHNGIRNISQIQISPGSKRHGNVSYIKISTTNIGKFKIINGSRKEYKTDGTETAKILFRRDKK